MRSEGGASEHDPAREHAARASFDVEVACRGRPVVELVGPEAAYLFTDAGELLSVGPDARALAPFDDAPPSRVALSSVAALDASGAPVVGTATKRIARYARGAWEVKEHDAPVLALCATPAGVVAGDAGGSMTLFGGRRVPGLVAGEPVVEILARGAYAVVLGAEGGLWTTRWPVDEAGALAPLEAGRVGKAFGLFEAREGSFGVYGARRACVVDAARGRAAATSPDLGEIRRIVRLEGDAGYAALTDEGALLALDPALRVLGPFALPRKSTSVDGARPAPDGALLAWTSGGELFLVRRETGARRLAGEDVVFAYAAGAGCVAAHAIDGGVRLRTLRWS